MVVAKICECPMTERASIETAGTQNCRHPRISHNLGVTVFGGYGAVVVEPKGCSGVNLRKFGKSSQVSSTIIRLRFGDSNQKLWTNFKKDV